MRSSPTQPSISVRAVGVATPPSTVVLGPSWREGDADTESATALRVFRWLAPQHSHELLAAGLHRPEGLAMDEAHAFVTDLAWAEEPMQLRLLRVNR